MKLHRSTTLAVTESLSLIFENKKYADKVIEKILKKNSKWGARDRRFIAETTYNIVRWHRLLIEITQAKPNDYWMLIGGWCTLNEMEIPDWPELKGIHRKVILNRLEKVKSVRKIYESIPDWLDELGVTQLGKKWSEELKALNKEANVVLRTNTLKISSEELRKELYELEIDTTIDSSYPDALILKQRQNIFTTHLFKEGLFEIQDAGSQAIAPFLGVEPGMRVVDACAGGGGKTLHLSCLMQNKGKIIAMDTEAWKLEELKLRARRAGANNIETRLIESSKTIKRMEGSADRLLLDVPCSGLGVLRRNPDAKWKLSVDFINRVKELQQHILRDYSSILKNGGRLVYSTCSILPEENEKQIEKFLKDNPNFKQLDEHRLWPSQGYDGFYMALLEKI